MQTYFSLDEIDQIAFQILSKNPNKIILFNGEMGVGKTTLIKAVTKALGVIEATSSPTFSLVNEYQTQKGKIVYHFDLYRLKKEEEAYDIGIDEYLYSDNWCFIEWAEKIPNLIPREHTIIKLKRSPNGKRQLLMK